MRNMAVMEQADFGFEPARFTLAEGREVVDRWLNRNHVRDVTGDDFVAAGVDMNALAQRAETGLDVADVAILVNAGFDVEALNEALRSTLCTVNLGTALSANADDAFGRSAAEAARAARLSNLLSEGFAA